MQSQRLEGGKEKSQVKFCLDMATEDMDKELSANYPYITSYATISSTRAAIDKLRGCKTDEDIIKIAQEQKKSLANSMFAIGSSIFIKHIDSFNAKIQSAALDEIKSDDIFTCSALLPDNRKVVGLKNGSLRIYSKGEMQCEFEEHKSYMTDCGLSLDKKHIISCSLNGGIFIRDLDGKVLTSKEDESSEKFINKILRDGTIAQVGPGGKEYEFYLMSDEIKLERNKLYVREKNNHFAYTVITPNGEVVRDIEIASLPAPNPIPLDKLNKVKNKILEVALKAGHIQFGESLVIYQYDAKENKLVAHPIPSSVPLKRFDFAVGGRFVANIESISENRYMLGIYDGLWSYGGLATVDRDGKFEWIIHLNSLMIAPKITVLSNNTILCLKEINIQHDEELEKQYKDYYPSFFQFFVITEKGYDKKILPPPFYSINTAPVELPHQHLAIAETRYDRREHAGWRLQDHYISIFDMRDGFKKVAEIPLQDGVFKLKATPEGQLLVITNEGKSINIDVKSTLDKQLSVSKSDSVNTDIKSTQPLKELSDDSTCELRKLSM